MKHKKEKRKKMTLQAGRRFSLCEAKIETNEIQAKSEPAKRREKDKGNSAKKNTKNKAQNTKNQNKKRSKEQRTTYAQKKRTQRTKKLELQRFRWGSFSVKDPSSARNKLAKKRYCTPLVARFIPPSTPFRRYRVVLWSNNNSLVEEPRQSEIFWPKRGTVPLSYHASSLHQHHSDDIG